MSSSGILLVTWVLVGVVVAAYIWFVVWRVRAERRKKAAQAAADAPLKAALQSPDLDAPSKPQVASSPAAPPVAPASVPAPAAAAAPVATQSRLTIVQALTGIQLPNDLVPLTTMAPRLGVGDRVAFWTDAAPAEVVGPAFAGELERLGYEVTPRDLVTLVAQRDDIRLTVVLHPDALLATIDDKPLFPSVPERAVVVEAWLTE
jgi:hypothetical protein